MDNKDRAAEYAALLERIKRCSPEAQALLDTFRSALTQARTDALREAAEKLQKRAKSFRRSVDYDSSDGVCDLIASISEDCAEEILSLISKEPV